MKSTLFLSSLLLGTSGMTAQVIPQEEIKQVTNSRKNILFIAVDDLKPLLGCYGDPIAQTPHLDQLAARGTLFSHAYCQQAVSGPSRASLLTGMCPDNTKVWDLKTFIRAANPDVVTLPQQFKNNGYQVAGIGKIYDPRSVDKGADVLSWSDAFMEHTTFLNSDYQQPVFSQYQSPETRKLYNQYQVEAKAKGLAKKNEIENYIRECIKPSVESVHVPDDAYTDGAIANGAVSFIEKYNSDKPFFLAVGFKKPHLPFCAPTSYWDLYKREEMPLAAYRKKAENSPDFAYHQSGELQSYTDIPSIISFTDIDNAILPDSKARELIHGYYACVSYIDAMVGQVLDALNKKGLADHTIIVLWGDHGWHLGDHGLWNKHSNFEQATHVPMLIVDPSSRPQKVNAPVEFLDIYPTLCELSGISLPEHLDGQSLAGVVTGKVAETAIRPYATSQFHRGNRMGYSIRDERYRYTIWVDWKNRKTDVTTVLAEELYDYQSDPNETVSVVDKPEHKAALQQMRNYWIEYINARIN